MTNQLELYSDTERKQDLVEKLEKILDQQLSSSEVLDAKAWELSKVSSATFGLVSALEITLTGGNVSSLFWGTLSIVLLCYAVQSLLVIIIVRPRKWQLVPGVPDGKPLLFSTFLQNYMAEYDPQLGEYVFKDESRYLDQLLTDYLGRKSLSDPQQIEPGAITTAQKHNEAKARLMVWVSGLLAAIIIGLILMAIVAVGTGQSVTI